MVERGAESNRVSDRFVVLQRRRGGPVARKIRV